MLFLSYNTDSFEFYQFGNLSVRVQRNIGSLPHSKQEHFSDTLSIFWRKSTSIIHGGKRNECPQPLSTTSIIHGGQERRMPSATFNDNRWISRPFILNFPLKLKFTIIPPFKVLLNLLQHVSTFRCAAIEHLFLSLRMLKYSFFT